MPYEDIESAQECFLRNGGIFAPALLAKRKSGEIPRTYEYQEYPKAIYLSLGVKKIERSTTSVDKQIIKWTEEKEAFQQIIVSSEEEEERVLSGGKTSHAMEEERQSLILRCRNAGIRVDAGWSVLRLKRELGDKMSEPVDDMGALKAKLAQLEEMAAMKAKIAALEAELSGKVPEPVDDLDDLRGQLFALGVKVDGRWSGQRLREELDRATAPNAP